MLTAKKLTIHSVLALFILTIPIVSSAQNDDTTGRRLKYVTNTEPRLIEAKEIGPLPKRTVSLDKSVLASPEEARLLEREAFELVNLRRLELGLAELKWNQALADLARQHSQNMALNGFFSHIGLNGKLVDRRAADFGLDDWRAIGENIAFNKGFANPTSFAVDRWMNSDGHRNNLLDRQWTESGLGVAITVDGKYFFTQIFMVVE
jgi:uncharacterized protein YkwD